MKMTIVSIK